MKNTNDHEIRQGKIAKVHKTMPVSIAVSPEVVEKVIPDVIPRRRKRNYEKKIMNDPFIFTV